MKKRILFLGCGKMGGAIMKNFINNNISRNDILVIDPNSDVADLKAIDEVDNSYVADIVIFAIKPQNSESALQDFAKSNLYNKDSIFISILAGKKVSFFENILGEDKKIIRLMPNLPILIGEGASAYFANKNVKSEEEDIVDLFGKNLKLENEDLINQATAISGSGPAYLFLFAKCIIESGIKIGLSEEASGVLAKQTILGASKMLLEEDNLDQLINNVTSKGGTTQAALEVFNANNSMQNLIQDAIKAALKKSKELSS